MRQVKKFSKIFKAVIIIYALFIIAGFVLIFTKGLNKGVDFQAGFVAQVRFAPTVLSLSYDGTNTVTFSQDTEGVYIVTTSINSENTVESFLFSDYKTVGDFIAGHSKIEGLIAKSYGHDDVSLSSLFTSSAESLKLSAKPLKLHSAEATTENISSDDVRQTLSSVEGLSVRRVGEVADSTFQFRLAGDNPEKSTSVALNATLTSALDETYGADNYAYLSTDFMGSQFSASLMLQSALLVIFSVGLIFLYVMIRFKWSFAVSAIIALVIDAFTMVVYMSITQLEFSTFTVAALLTIIGYSINDTVVMFDRIRENTRLFPNMLGTEIIDKSITEVLGRSIITTLTTMLAVLILFLFTDGDSSNFANVLLIGLVSGVITSLLLATSILNLSCKDKKGQDIIRSKVAS